MIRSRRKPYSRKGSSRKRAAELENVKSDLQKKYLEENTTKIALKQLEGKKEELYESSSDMNLENRQLEEQIHELRDSLAAIAEEIKSLEQENTDRNAKIESDSAALEQAKADRDNASAALSEVQLEAANLKQQDSFLDQNIHRLEEEKNRLLTEKMSLRDGHTDSKNEVEKRLAQIKELKQKIENAGKDAETYYQEMTAAQEEKAAKNEARRDSLRSGKRSPRGSLTWTKSFSVCRTRATNWQNARIPRWSICGTNMVSHSRRRSSCGRIPRQCGGHETTDRRGGKTRSAVLEMSTSMPSRITRRSQSGTSS